MNDLNFMEKALEEAKKAADEDEVPVGAILVDQDGSILASGHNLTLSLNDPTAHAEILTMRSAASILENYRLTGTTLYSTVEPCLMCMGAVIHARIKRVVFGAYDKKWGGCGSLYDFAADRRLNHKVDISGGVLEEQCRGMMQDFFRMKRKILQLSKS